MSECELSDIRAAVQPKAVGGHLYGAAVLKQFIYLNEPALNDYLSALEDGLRGSVEERETTTTSGAGKIGLAGTSVGGEHERAQESTTSRSDTRTARFERLQRLARADVDASGWIDVVNADVDMAGVGTGALVEIECEIYVPEVVRALSPNGGLGRAMEQMQALLPAASAMGLEVPSIPELEQLGAIRDFSSALGGDLMLVGEPLEGEWRVAGKLLDTHLSGEIDGYAKVVGKVATRWGSGQWKPLLALPGMNLMSREQRRAMERKGPEPTDRDNWLEGPAVMLDLLAVYR